MQAPLWNTVPQDVLQAIFQQLPAEDVYACRGLSSCWALAVNTCLPVEYVVLAAHKNLRAKMDMLQQTSRQPTSRADAQRMLTFKVPETLTVFQGSKLLNSLTGLVGKKLQTQQKLDASPCLLTWYCNNAGQNGAAL